MTGRELITIARQHVDTRWRHQGRLIDDALDCVGLLIVVARQAQLDVEDMRNYDLRAGSKTLYAQLARYCDEISTGAPRQAGDILVVSVAGEDPQHTLLWTGEGTVLHASARHRKVVEHRYDEETRRG